MGTLHNDLFMRDNFGDTGIEPVTDAYVSASPDIMPYGNGTMTQQEIINSYGPPLINVPIKANNINNIYVRAKNNYNGAASGQIYLYYATGNLLVQVSAWRTNTIPNANGTFAANISAAANGAIAPGDQPFYFNPSPNLGTHFCLLGRVQTQMHPNPLPSSNFNSWQDFVNWVRNNANVAWHNVDVVNTLPAQGYQNGLAFQNVNTSSQFFGFQTNYTNMPAGSQLRLYALANNNAGFTGFDTGTVTINNINGSIGGGAIFPGNYQTTIFTTCVFPGSPVTPPPNVTIETISLGYQSSLTRGEEELYKTFMYPPRQIGIDPSAYHSSAGGAFVQITSFSALFSPSGSAAPLRTTHRR